MTRVLSGAALFVLAVVTVWFSPPAIFFAAAEALVVLAFSEYLTLARSNGFDILAAPAAAAAMLTCAAFAVPLLPVEVALMGALVATATLALSSWRGGRDGLGLATASLFPSLYLGLPLGALVSIRGARGAAPVFLLMLTVIVSDTAQYYSGRAFGRRLLAPAISPKKTVEGALGGLVLGAVTLAVAGAWWLPSVPVALRAALGVAVAAVGISGDLFESMLKRSAGVKDSSSLIPGHGGVLDRIDALLFAAPVYYVVLKYV